MYFILPVALVSRYFCFIQVQYKYCSPKGYAYLVQYHNKGLQYHLAPRHVCVPSSQTGSGTTAVDLQYSSHTLFERVVSWMTHTQQKQSCHWFITMHVHVGAAPETGKPGGKVQVRGLGKLPSGDGAIVES